MKSQLTSTYKTIFQSHQTNPVFGHILRERGFVFQYDKDEAESDLLFLGMNPSYTEKYEKAQYFEDSYTRNTDRIYFKVFSLIHQQLLDSLGVEKLGNWTHIDLFVFRETNQKLIDKIMKSREGAVFLLKQLEVAKNRLIHIAPKVVVVSNAKAAEFTGKNRFEDKNGKEHGVWMGLEFKFDEEFGSHRVTNIPELAHTHFFFSSMLSGQRALDLGSRERLVWQVKRVLESN